MRNIKADQQHSDHRSSDLGVVVDGSSTWKYSQGARQRQRLFNINEDIRSMSKRIKDDSDHIPDPTQSSSSQQRKLSANRSLLQNKSIEEIHLFEASKLHSVNLHKNQLRQEQLLNSNNNSNMNMMSISPSNETIKQQEIDSNIPSSHPIFHAMGSPKKESPKNPQMQSIQLMRGSTSSYQIGSEQGAEGSKQLDDSNRHSPQRLEESPPISRSHYYEDNDGSPIKLLRSTTKFANYNNMTSYSGRPKDLTLRGSMRLSGTEKDNLMFSAPSVAVGISNALSNFLTKMKISSLTRRFISKISQFSQKYNYLRLQKKHFDIIGDPASSVSNSQLLNSNGSLNPLDNNDQTSNPTCWGFGHTKSCMLLWTTLETWIAEINPLNPESRFSILCDISYGFVLLSYLYVVPIQLSFQVSFFWFEQFVFAVFLLNFLITLNKSYYSQGIMITSKKKIISHFIRTQLFIDVLVFITIQLGQFQFVAFLKFFDINKIVKRADNHFQMIRKYPIAFTLTNLVLKMTLMAQIAGCAFHYVAHVEVQNGSTDNWLSSKGVENETWQNRYIISIYFSFITMMTIGYGDVTPVNNTERIYVIFMTFISSGIFGYVVNTIGELYMQQRQKIEQFQKRKQEITVYMDTRNIDSLSKLKVLNYLEYAFQYKKKKDSDAQTLFQDIPYTLVSEIYQKYFGKYLFENKIMRLNFSEKCLRALALCMKEKNIAPNEYLFYRGERGSAVYFLASGTIDIVIENQFTITTISTVQKHGDEIGMRSSFIDGERSTSAKCQKDQTCTLVYFDMADFKNILVKYQKDFERYSELRDDIIFNNHTLDTKCPSCQKYDHQFIYCPLINFNAPEQNIIARCQNSGEPSKRAEYARKKFSYRTMAMQELTRQKLRLYRVSLVQLIMPDIRDNIPEFNNRSDKYFFDKVPTVRILENCQENEGEMEEYNIYEDYDGTMIEDRGRTNDEEFDEEDEDDDDEYDEDINGTERLKLQFQQQFQQQQQSNQQSNFQSQQNSTYQQQQSSQVLQKKQQQSFQQSSIQQTNSQQQQWSQLQAIQDDDHNHLGNSGEQLQQPGDSNIIQTSTYSSNNGNLTLTQLQPSALSTIPVNQLSSGQGRDSFQTQNLTSTIQKISFFSKKQIPTQENILMQQQQVPTTTASPQQDNLTQLNTAVNQQSARTLSFRRERGDSFFPPMRGSKSYVQQRSLQSKVKSSRKMSELQISFKPSSHVNSSVSIGGVPVIGQGNQNLPNVDLYLLDFDRMRIYEKYFPSYNYPVILGKMVSRKKTIAGISRNRKGVKTIVLSPSRRKSRK